MTCGDRASLPGHRTYNQQNNDNDVHIHIHIHIQQMKRWKQLEHHMTESSDVEEGDSCSEQSTFNRLLNVRYPAARSCVRPPEAEGKETSPPHFNVLKWMFKALSPSDNTGLDGSISSAQTEPKVCEM